MIPAEDDVKLAQMAVRHLPELENELRRRDSYKILRYFQEDGPYRRAFYPKALAFFAAGGEHRERAVIAANRVGKTDLGSYETTLHLTGEYPDWWPGRRFRTAVRAWAAGTTNEKVKEILQAKLLGPETARGTGMIPARAIHSISHKGAGVIEAVFVRHRPTNTLSELKFKSYEAGRAAFEGTEQHLIWLDEEPPLDVYTECLLRTMATGDFVGGILFLTFTPLAGQTQVVNRFTPMGVFPPNGLVPETEEQRA